MRAKAPAVREKIGRVGQRRQVVIPRELCNGLDLHEGDFVAFVSKPGGVLIKPKKMIDPDDVLTPQERAIVRKAEREMELGEFTTLADLRNELDRPRTPRRRKTA